MEKPDRAQCSVCAYWERMPPSREMDDDVGLCRRYPPTVLLDDGEPFTMWPLTDDVDLCGEYRARMNA